MKFKVGQVWKCRDGESREVTEVNSHCVATKRHGYAEQRLTLAGKWDDKAESPFDLIALVKDVEEPKGCQE